MQISEIVKAQNFKKNTLNYLDISRIKVNTEIRSNFCFTNHDAVGEKAKLLKTKR